MEAVEVEFQQWFESYGCGDLSLYLQEHHRLRDGAIRMDVAFSDDSTFTIVCPGDYPNGTDMFFDIRSSNERLQKDWLPQIRAYAAANRGHVKLPAVLSKCVDLRNSSFKSNAAAASAATSVPSPQQQDSDFEDEPVIGSAYQSSDDEMEDLVTGDENFTTAWDIEMDMLKKRWKQKENEMREQLFQNEKVPETCVASSSNAGMADWTFASPNTASDHDGVSPVSMPWGVKITKKGGQSKKKEKLLKSYGLHKWESFLDLDNYNDELMEPMSGSDFSFDMQLYGGDSASFMALPKKTKFDDSDETPKAGQQIFEHGSAAFQILSNEMIALLMAAKNEMTESGECQFCCEAVDDSLYQWRVKLNAFPRDHPLHNELAILKSKFGYDTIELQLDFIPEFPFYPPLLRLVRPRLKGSLVQSVANIDILKLTFWNPTKTVHEVLKEIKEILIKHARLDIENERNDISKYPEGAYLPLEDYLIKLALATEVQPRANFEVIAIDNLERAPQIRAKITSGKAKFAKTIGGWKAGTGYGTGSRVASGWNPESYVIAQQEKDKQILGVLKRIIEEMRSIVSCVGKETDEIYAITEGSCLIPYLEQQLAVGSFIEIGRHLELYRLILDVIEMLSEANYLLPLFGNLTRQKFCIVALLQKLRDPAAQYLERMHSVSEATGGSSKDGSTKPKHSKNQPSSVDTDKKLKDDQELVNAKRIVEVFQKVKAKLSAAGIVFSTDEQIVPFASSSADKPTLDQIYVSRLKPLQFDTVTMELTGPNAHKFAKNATDNLSSEKRAIWKEWSALRTSLPINLESSVFVRVDESHVNLLRALIVGPEGTPYANGCFCFDVCFPVNYPAKPPQVLLRTTGGGNVRFNPNLYNCGKVCLSLLGTWSGESSESWNAKTSTLLQVLVSIQSLILVDEPYFNEPGYESSMGTPEAKANSERYNKGIRENCVRYAMLQQLEKPEAGFEDIVRLHYQIRREAVIKQLDEWIQLDAENVALKADVEKMKRLLKNLPSLK